MADVLGSVLDAEHVGTAARAARARSVPPTTLRATAGPCRRRHDLAVIACESTAASQPDTRLIERWLPIAEIGEEATRERRSMTALAPTYYLHVWWTRWPLVASRAAILASLLSADADRNGFLHMIGIHGDPLKAREAIDEALRTGVRVKDP